MLCEDFLKFAGVEPLTYNNPICHASCPDICVLDVRDIHRRYGSVLGCAVGILTIEYCVDIYCVVYAKTSNYISLEPHFVIF